MHLNTTAICVFTAKAQETILKDGGSQAWKLNRNHAKNFGFLVCCRSGVSWVEGPEAKGTAFLVGRIKDIVPATDTSDAGRSLIRIRDFATIDIPDAWTGRNPVRYTTLEEIGIDASKLTFQPLPGAALASEAQSSTLSQEQPLTIAIAKRGLARTYGVREESIEITIRG